MRRRSSVVHPPEPGAPKIRVRHCHTLAECERCLELQREAWGFEDRDAVPVPLFVVAIRTGGQVLGAFDGDRMIGFTLAVAGWRDHRPLQVKNGYFNLVRLGAIVRRIQPNLYGITSSPLHGGLPTDRFVAEWHLTSPRVRRAMATATGSPAEAMLCRANSLARSPSTLILPAMNACIPTWGLPSTRIALAVA